MKEREAEWLTTTPHCMHTHTHTHTHTHKHALEEIEPPMG